jgi:hypothetical protein
LEIQSTALAQSKDVLELGRIEVERVKAKKKNGALPVLPRKNPAAMRLLLQGVMLETQRKLPPTIALQQKRQDLPHSVNLHVD